MLTLKGLILRENDCGESSKSVSFLTAERGVIDIYIRGGRKSTKSSSATQLFSYSTFCIDEKKDAHGQSRFYLNSAESINIFYNIRLEAKKTALAAYMAELILYTRTENTDCTDILRLSLNTFYFLNSGKIDIALLKSIFEFRLLCELGLCPALLGCSVCMAVEADFMHFDLANSTITCDDCFQPSEECHDIVLDKTMVYIIRFIALTEYSRLFSFKISEKYQKQLSQFTENFIKYNLKSSFKTLDFYKVL